MPIRVPSSPIPSVPLVAMLTLVRVAVAPLLISAPTTSRPHPPGPEVRLVVSAGINVGAEVESGQQRNYWVDLSVALNLTVQRPAR